MRRSKKIDGLEAMIPIESVKPVGEGLMNVFLDKFKRSDGRMPNTINIIVIPDLAEKFNTIGVVKLNFFII